MARMFDASTPPDHAPAGYQAVAGYIGGATPHVWTHAEWDRFNALKKLPIWVGRIVTGAPAPQNEAFEALRRLFELHVPKGSPVVLDLETHVDGPYVRSFGAVLSWAGYRTWVYGSASSLFRNPPLGGYWVADYTGTPFMYQHKDVRATQYASGQTYDSSTVQTWQFLHRLRRW